MKKSYYIAIDFDGTIVKNAYPKIGRIRPSVIKMIKKRVNELKKDCNVKLILWTCRHGNELLEAIDICKKFDIQFFAVNSNPDFETGSRKIFANEYWDDRAVEIS